MNTLRKSIAIGVVATALGTPLAAVAMSPVDSYGRAGGAVWPTSAAHMAESNAQGTVGEQTPSTSWYGRAGGVVGSDRISQGPSYDKSSTEGAAMPAVPGRQGRALPIDDLRG
jgi:hypothetical protein